MPALNNAIKRRAHKERAQPAARKKFGLLEKKKDYVERAKNFHKKENTIKVLRLSVMFRLHGGKTSGADAWMPLSNDRRSSARPRSGIPTSSTLPCKSRKRKMAFTTEGASADSSMDRCCDPNLHFLPLG